MNAFKMEQNLSLSNGMGDVKVTSPEVTFDTSTDFSLAFFESSTPPPPGAIKKEPDFDENVFDSVAPDSIFSPSGDYGTSFEDTKFTPFSESSFHDSNPSTPNVSSPLPSPGINHGTNKILIKSEPSFQVADSTPAPSPATPMKAFVSCKVCGDKASGYHYGVTSCEGCKGFFRRSIQKQIEYRCLRDGKCLVIRLNRNRCQYCRFRKCLSVGMSRDCKKPTVRQPLLYSVRYGRVPKRSREREGSQDSRGSNEGPPSQTQVASGDTRQMAIYEIIYTISQAHNANCMYTEEKTRSLNRKHIVFHHNEITSDPEAATSTVDALEQQKINWWESFADHVSPSIQRIVEFAKRVPGFSELNQDDQLMLIKGGFFELWLTQISRLISQTDSTLTFSDGSYFDRSQLELMFDAEFISNIFNFAMTFNSLNLNDIEVALFVAVILLTGERPGITDMKAIEQHQDKIVEALKVQIERNHPNETHLFTSLAMKLPELRQIGNRHSEHINWFRSHWSRFKLPPLFAETMDIPKAEEEIQNL